MAATDDAYTTELGLVVTTIQGMTWEQAQQLQRAIVGAAKSPEHDGLVEAIDAISPDLAKIVGRHRKAGTMGLTVAVLLAVLSKCSVTVKVDLDLNEVLRDWNSPKPAASQGLNYPEEKEPQGKPDPASGGPGEEQRHT